MALDLNPPAQDLGIPQRVAPDRRWAHTRPVAMPVDQAWLEKPSQRVDIKNTSIQTHIIFNRQRQPVEIQPGETKRGIDMLVEDIAHFRNLRRPGQLDAIGMLRPLHPLVFTDVADDPGSNEPQPIPSGQMPLPLPEPEDQREANAPPLRKRPVNGQ